MLLALCFIFFNFKGWIVLARGEASCWVLLGWFDSPMVCIPIEKDHNCHCVNCGFDVCAIELYHVSQGWSWSFSREGWSCGRLDKNLSKKSLQSRQKGREKSLIHKLCLCVCAGMFLCFTIGKVSWNCIYYYPQLPNCGGTGRVAAVLHTRKV